MRQKPYTSGVVADSLFSIEMDIPHANDSLGGVARRASRGGTRG